MHPDRLDDIEAALDLIRAQIKRGRAIEEIGDYLTNRFPTDAVDAALETFASSQRRIRRMREVNGTIVEAAMLHEWYVGPEEHDKCWPPLHDLLRDRGWDPEDVDRIDKCSTQVVSCLAAPDRPQFNVRGLVVGHVQAGKTANYSAVISKAADAGYKLFIVLSGIHNNLRRQTQRRLQQETQDLNPDHWFTLTSDDDDFQRPGNVEAFLTDNTKKLLCVVKKQHVVLKRISRWLSGASELVRKSCQTLVIDDEADQASVNTGRVGAARTTTNRLILQILKQFPRVSYVAYTATPFANVLINPDAPEDLYPRDFIFSIPPSKRYFGSEKLFGREPLSDDDAAADLDGYDMIREIPVDEEQVIRPGRGPAAPYQPRVVASLDRSIRYFILASAARLARGEVRACTSMLVHVTLITDAHRVLASVIQRHIDAFSAEWQAGSEDLRSQLAQQWHEEQERLPPQQLGRASLPYNSVANQIPAVLERIVVVIENSLSPERLEYGDDPKAIIAVGGNTLSRGLTLEGLVVSYFTRAASAYDTLLQMGRWFGYRVGYEDLPRIWMTSQLKDWFRDLATVEEEVRREISQYASREVSPLEVSVRIRQLPQMAITSRLKMQSATAAQVSFSGQRLQTILFRHQDRAWLEANWQAGARLIRNALDSGVQALRALQPTRWILEGVPSEQVLAFLGDYRFHPDSRLDGDQMTRYIRNLMIEGELRSWNVVVMGADSIRKTTAFNLPEDVPLLVRSRLKAAGDANIKALMSKVDLRSDVRDSLTQFRQKKTEELLSRPAEAGLLVLYPIDRNSTPHSADGSTGDQRPLLREPLGAAHDILGVAIVFPQARSRTAVDYITVELPDHDFEEPVDESRALTGEE